MLRSSLFAVAASLSIAASALAAPAAPSRPNILVVVVDDMGFSDLGCYGGEISTPRLDALAARGMRFTQFYTNPACAPTRASLLTGLDAPAVGIATNNVRPDDPFWTQVPSPAYHAIRPDGPPTVAMLLRDAGYQTFMTGKWHQGEVDGLFPRQRGFDRYFGVLWGAVTNQFRPGREPFLLDDKPVTDFPADFHTTDAFTDYALRFLREGDATRPWFLYVAYTAPHLPWDARPEDVAPYVDLYRHTTPAQIRAQRLARQQAAGLFPAHLAPSPLDTTSSADLAKPDTKWAANMARYAGMIQHVDRSVGRLVDELRARGQLDNTLILFLSDNGMWGTPIGAGHAWAEACDTPFRLFKGHCHEGAIRTSFIAHWPAAIPPGTINRSHYGHVKDLPLTFLQLAGATPPPAAPGRPAMDGSSLLPALRDPAHAAPDRPLHWSMGGNDAYRDGRWKLVRTYNAERTLKPETDRSGAWELYDLEADPGETRDLAKSEPKRLATMIAAHGAWAERVGLLPEEDIVARLRAYLASQKTGQ